MRPFLAIAAALLAAAPAGATAWTPTPDDALLLETRLGAFRIGEGVRGYATPGGGACLLFADVAAGLDLAIDVDAAAGTAKGWAFSEANRVEIDRRAGRLSLRGKAGALGRDLVRDTPEGWCIDAGALSSWLGVDLKVDSSNALLVVVSGTKLPVERAMERRARAASMRPATPAIDPAKLPWVKLPYLLWRMPALDAVVTVNGVRDRRSGSDLQRRYELFAAGEALRMSVDARLASDDRGVPATLRARAYRTDPEGGLLGPLKATHLGFGDVSGFASPLVAQPGGGRGAVATNRPVDRPDSFDRTSFRGELPGDWDAELYRNGQLLAFAGDRADGRYEFLDVPLLYGVNRFEIVLYGPQGQVRRRSETVSVGADSIPTGKTYWWAGFSQDGRDLITLRDSSLGPGGGGGGGGGRGWRGSVGIEHGVGPRTSLSAQVHTLLLRDERLTFVEGAVRQAVGPALLEMSIAAEAGGSLAARAQLLGQLGNTYISAESILVTRGFRSDRIDPGTRSRHLLSLDHSLALGRTLLPLHGEARYVDRVDGGGALEAAARLSANFRDFSLTGGLDWQSQRARGRDPPPRLAATLLANGRVGRVRVRGEARYRVSGDDQGFDGATLVGEWGAGDRAQWRAEIGYDATTSRGRGAMGYSRRLDKFALGVSAEAATDGSIAAGLNLAFSVGAASGGGLRVTSSKLGRGGSALARVFRDLNADGIRGADEPFEAGVQLTAGTSAVGAVTNARGETTIDELAPFRAVAVGVDQTSLADPTIRPRTAGVRMVPRPGLPIALDIALVGAGEVEGSLVGGGDRTLEGVDLELVDAGGAVAAATRSDFDGYFLFESVAYGNYTLRVATLSAEAARVSRALNRSLSVGGQAPTVRLGTVRAIPTMSEIAVGGAMTPQP